MTIRHYSPGTLDECTVRQYIRDGCAAFPNELGNVENDSWPIKLCRFADCFCTLCADGKLSAALFAYLNDTSARIGYIPLLCSLPNSEKGAAYNIHESCRKMAAEVGMSRIRLEVIKTNSHAIEFYRRQGYNVVEDHRDTNRWLMELTLLKSSGGL